MPGALPSSIARIAPLPDGSAQTAARAALTRGTKERERPAVLLGMQRVLSRLLPRSVRAADTETVLRARLIVGFSLALALCGLPNVASLLASGLRHAALAVAVSLALTALTTVALSLTRSVVFAARWLVATMFFGMLYIAYSDGGVTCPGFVFNFTIPMLTMTLLGTRAAVIMTAAVACESVGFVVLDKMGLLPAVVAPADARAQNYSAGGITAMLTIFALARIYEKRRIEVFAALQAEKAKVESAHASARVVLDSVAQGLLVADAEGRIGEERSEALTRWFGAAAKAPTLDALFRSIAPEVADWLAVSYGDVFTGDLPREVVLSQLPGRFSFGGSIFAVDYTVLDEDRHPQMLVMITDITSVVARERAEEDQRELLSVVQWLLRDRAAAFEAFAEMQGRAARLGDADGGSVQDRRELHTIKGNAGVFGLQRLVRLCHRIEDELAAGSGALTEAHREAIIDHLAELERRLGPLLGRGETTAVAVSRGEHAAALDAIARRAPHVELDALVRSWADEPARSRLEIQAEQARRLAARLGKGPIEICIDDNGLRLPHEPYGAVWSSLVHVVRNAVDHGVEPPEERRILGKSAARLTFATRVVDRELVIEVSDDGRGIDWDRLSDKASARGLPTSTTKDLVDALFADGVSTCDDASDTSGRGVGMAAVRRAVEDLGGRIDVTSVARRGTTIALRIPHPPRQNASGPVGASAIAAAAAE